MTASFTAIFTYANTYSKYLVKNFRLIVCLL